MGQQFVIFRARVIAAYTCLFGAFFGDIVYGERPAGLFALWLAMGVLGVSLVIVKQSGVADARVRWRLYLADGLALGALLLLRDALPASIGALRGLIILLAISAYVTLVVRWLYSGRIIASEA